MAKFTEIAEQTVAGLQNFVFTDDVIRCSRGFVTHIPSTGIITLKAPCQGCARYRVSFGANVAIPEGGTVAPITVALALEGSAIPSATAILTPAAAGDLNHISIDDYITVPSGCCVNLTVKNLGADPITAQNANLIVDRTA